MVEDFDRCYRLVQSRDPRYDGVFFSAVTSTRVYCRPSCPARTPKPSNVRFYSTAAAAQTAGFRACKRCRPETAPGSPAWNWRADTAARAMRLIAGGTVDREGVAGLADRLGYSERHLRRLLIDQVGVGPVALARAQRAQTARQLIEASSLPFAHVAVASGFGSVREFNETVRSVFASTPTELRRRHATPSTPVAQGTLKLRLTYREPFDAESLLDFLPMRAVPSVEEVVGKTYRRSVSFTFGTGIVEITAEQKAVRCVLRLDDLRDVADAVARCRRLFDLDADPVAIANSLADDDLIGPLVRARPGLRVPGCIDGDELVLRTVLGQRLSIGAARVLITRLVELLGRPVHMSTGGITHLFPTAIDLAEADPRSLPVSGVRRDTLHCVASRLAARQLRVDPGADAAEALATLRAIPGVEPWAISSIAMHGFHDPDAFPDGDESLSRALEPLLRPSDRHPTSRLAERWRPWRAYAALTSGHG